jgi:cation/acetate symporter
LLSIKSTSFGAIGALVNFAVAFVVSNATKSPPQEIQDLVESIRVPKGAGAAQSH